MPPEHSKPARLAAVAYQAALVGKWEAATRAVQRLSDECGGDGVRIALLAWCDAYVDHATDGKPGRASPRVRFVNSKTGELDGRAV